LCWHSDIYKDKNYHLNKTINCVKKDIRLIHIFEDEWVYKKHIIQSLILNIICKNDNNICINSCVIKNVNIIDEEKFLNHINGYIDSDYRYGLYFNNKIN